MTRGCAAERLWSVAGGAERERSTPGTGGLRYCRCQRQCFGTGQPFDGLLLSQRRIDLEQIPLIELDCVRAEQIPKFIGERRPFVMRRLAVDVSNHTLDL